MNIFFGKISQKFDTVQLKEGYYSAPKDSSWFGELELGDYVYMIGGEKIQFWKAEEWGLKNDRESLIFEIINPDLGINGSQLIALKFLKFTRSLAVMSSRSARNKAFFKLELNKEISIADLSNSDFYKSQDLYRSIRIIKQEEVIENSEDIQLIYENSILQLVDNNFIEESTKKDFIDNLDKKGKGAKMKDNVLDFFSNAVNNLPTEITYKQIGLRSFYDTFFCNYKDKSIEENSEPKYWLYAPGENATKWDEFYTEGIMALGWDDIGTLEQYKTKREINDALVNQYGGNEDKKNDVAANDNFINKLDIEDVIIVKKGRGELLGYGIVSSEYYFDEKRDNYKHCRKVNWSLKGNWKLNFSLVLKTLTDITRYSTDDPRYSYYYQLLLAIMEGHDKNDIQSITKREDQKQIVSLNQILYGPPGTGKTYELQQIIKDWGLDEKAGNEKDYNSFVKNYTWWQIIALVLTEKGKTIVPELAKHPLIIAKLGSSNIKSLNTRLWSSLQNHTVDNCANVKLVKRIGNKVFYKEKNSEWRLDNVSEFQAEFASIIEDYEEFKTSDNIKTKDYTFTTCHQSLSYEDFIEGIKPNLDDSSKLEAEDGESKNLTYEIRKGIFYNACEKAVQKAGFINLKDCLDKTKEERRIAFEEACLKGDIHVLFLDEINRCNVSGVFGELITIIEEDKRLGSKNEISDIILPYSQDQFGVPPNLYIIGTMNTADRSVEALDSALRRRFSFTELMPQAELLKDISFSNFNLQEVLEAINGRIEILLDRDHTIGHSYFLNVESGETENLQKVFENCIIPLLQEYFYHDYEKIALILGEGFVECIETSENLVVFAKFSKAIDIPNISRSFKLKKDIKNIENSITLLLNR